MIRSVFQRSVANRAKLIKSPDKRMTVIVPMPSPVLGADNAIPMRQMRTHLVGSAAGLTPSLLP